MAAYFDAAMLAMRRAKRSVHLLNWAFEPQTLFHPEPGCTGPDSDRIGEFLKALADQHPEIHVRVLCWKAAMPVAATQAFFPLAGRKVFANSNVKFVLDGKLPRGACHHQKLIVVDDAVAFCGGGDIGPDRWDTPDHLDDDPRREKTRRDNKCFDSRHELMALVEGEAARVLGDLFRDRWLRATGETLPAPAETLDPPWPDCATAQFSNVSVGVSRTAAAWRDHPAVREVEALHLASIRKARDCIYMENQYFTSPVIAAALAERLAEPDGPEVVLISARRSPSYFDQTTMDRTRSRFIKQLRSADAHGRFQAYSVVTTLARTIIVHAKLTIIDDVLLRVGSANISNRSMGFDTECDLSFEAEPNARETRRAIAAIRQQLLAHWLGCSDAAIEDSIAREGSVGRGLESLRLSGHTRIQPIQPQPLKALAALVATYHLGDPVGPGDAWKPWRRRRAIKARIAAASL